MALGLSIFVPLAADFLSKSCTNLEFLIEPSVCPHKKQSYQGVGRVASIHRAAEKGNSAKFACRILHSPIPMQAEKYRFTGRAANRKPSMLWRCIKMQQGECGAACSERGCGAGCSSHLRRTCDGKTALPGKTPTVSEISNPDYSSTIWQAPEAKPSRTRRGGATTSPSHLPPSAPSASGRVGRSKPLPAPARGRSSRRFGRRRRPT